MNELTLNTGPYRTTYVGTEIVRESTPDEWRVYGEILKRVDEAKQWAIGDWLCDGKKHYGDKVYKNAADILDYTPKSLREFKSLSERFELSRRLDSVMWGHHYEVASLKLVEEKLDGKLALSNDPDSEKMQELLGKAEKKGWSVRELRGQVKQYKLSQQKEIELANEPEKFKVIYADPPWEYADMLPENYGAASHHYPTMSIEDLCRLKIKNIAMDNSVLFLWVTSPLLFEVEPVIEAWGFKYKAQFIWDKVKHNYGHYNSVRHELLLICTRGLCLPQNDELFDSVKSIERSETHSAKPLEFRELIDEMYPEGKRIELFARGKLPENWQAWGNES